MRFWAFMLLGFVALELLLIKAARAYSNYSTPWAKVQLLIAINFSFSCIFVNFKQNSAAGFPT